MRIVLASYLVRGASTTVVMLPLVILGVALHRDTPRRAGRSAGGRDSGRVEAESQPGDGSESRLVATACGEAGTR